MGLIKVERWLPSLRCFLILSMNVGSHLHEAKALTSNAAQVVQIVWCFDVVIKMQLMCAKHALQMKSSVEAG
jgi:hypothetical protein